MSNDGICISGVEFLRFPTRILVEVLTQNNSNIKPGLYREFYTRHRGVKYSDFLMYILLKICAIKLCSQRYNETKELELNGD